VLYEFARQAAQRVQRFRVVEHVDAVILIAEIDQVCLYQVELGPPGRPLLFRPDPTAPTSMDGPDPDIFASVDAPD